MFHCDILLLVMFSVQMFCAQFHDSTQLMQVFVQNSQDEVHVILSLVLFQTRGHRGEYGNIRRCFIATLFLMFLCRFLCTTPQRLKSAETHERQFPQCCHPIYADVVDKSICINGNDDMHL